MELHHTYTNNPIMCGRNLTLVLIRDKNIISYMTSIFKNKFYPTTYDHKIVSFLNHQYEIFSDLRNDFRYALAYKKKYTPTIAGVWQEFHAKNSPVYLQIN